MMVAELERLGALEESSAIDYVCRRTAEGDTLASICRDVSAHIKQTVGAGTLSSWINSDHGRKAKMAVARLDSAHVLAEDSVDLADQLAEEGTELTREEIALLRERTEGRRWLASKRDRATYGGDVAQVNVQVNTGQLHLDALRQRQIESKAQPMLPPAEADVEVVSD
jgi:hypothetical protein